MRARSSEASGSSSSSSRGCISKRAAERDALALAAGQMAGPARQQVTDVEQRQDALAFRMVGRDAAHPAPVVEVLRHGEMREQPAFLEHVADAALVRRHVHARRAVEQHRVVERNPPAVRCDQAGDHVDDRSLAGTGAAEQGGDAAGHFELGREAEVAEPFLDVDGEHRFSRNGLIRKPVSTFRGHA